MDTTWDDISYPSERRVSVDKDAYNFMLAAYLEEVKAIGCLEVLRLVGENDKLYVTGYDSPETELVWKQFQALYNTVPASITKKTIKLPHELQNSSLPNQLQDKFPCICGRIGNGDISVICWTDDLDKIMSHVDDTKDRLEVCTYGVTSNSTTDTYVHDHGIGLATVSPGTVTTHWYQNSTQDTITLPTGYDVGGRYHVILQMADMTSLHVDAITNAANGHLNHGGGIALAIARAAGPQLSEECASHTRGFETVPVSQVVRTTAGNLPCNMVLHAVGPRWPRILHTAARDRECVNKLRDTFYNVLDTAEQEGAKSVALPPISSGTFRVPLDRVASALVDAIFMKAQKASVGELKYIHIVDLTDRFLTQLTQKLNSLSHNRAENRGGVTVTPLQTELVKAAVDHSHNIK